MFSSLGILHSKINLLFTCLTHSAILKGFRLTWSEQTGFKSDELSSTTKNCINQTSLNLQYLVLVVSLKEFHAQLDRIFGMFSTFPPFIWARGVKNYRFLFSQYSVKHQKKLSDIVLGAQLKHLFPEISFSSMQNIDLNLQLSKLRDSLPMSINPDVVDIHEGYPRTSGSVSAKRNNEFNLVAATPATLERSDEVDVVVMTPATLQRSSEMTQANLQRSEDTTPATPQRSNEMTPAISQTSNEIIPVTLQRSDEMTPAILQSSDEMAPETLQLSSSPQSSDQNADSSLSSFGLPPSRPAECNVLVFTPEMISPVYYDPANFAPMKLLFPILSWS